MQNRRTFLPSILCAVGLGIILATIIQYYLATSLIINSLIAVIFLLLGIIMYQQTGRTKEEKSNKNFKQEI